MSEDNEERRRKVMETLSLQIDKYPRDLLQTFMSSDNTQQSQNAEPEGDSEEIELNLGLSLGGRFGVDKHAKKLVRSSSIVGTMPLVREDESTTPPTASYSTLLRTSSLPTETEEEWRKRKELQTLRRMEAKRRRSEKQRSSKTERDGRDVGEGRGEIEGPKGSGWAFKLPSGAPAAAGQVVLSDVLAKEKAHGLSGGTAGFQGVSSSGMPERESKPFQGSSNCGEPRSPISNQLLQERSKQDAMGSSRTETIENMIRTSSEVENPSKKPHPTQSRGREIGSNLMEDMPCVFTQGNGPDGKRIEGILYRYGKGQEVRIMCVCHGNFLSPAEFVKHAGGGDVAYPLKHIVVNPSSTPYL